MQIVEAAEHYHRLILFAYALYAVVFGALLSMRDEEPGRRLPVSFIAISLIALLLLRLPAIFPNVAFDPDEAQYIAAAIRLVSNPNSWASVDINSSGPLNGYSLMWPFAFGLDAGFGLAHGTALVVLAATWLLLLFALRWAPPDVRVFLGAALIVLLGGTASSPLSLLGFTSELVPSLLLMVAAGTVLAAAAERPSIARLLLAAFCLGAVPFAKLQGVVVALTIGLILLVQTLRTQPKPWRAILLLAIAACLPAAMILGPLAATGNLSDFWTSYIVSNAAYSQGGYYRVSSTGHLPPQIEALNRVLLPSAIRRYLESLALSVFIVAAAFLVKAGWERARRSLRDRLSHPDAIRCLLAGLMLAAGFVAAAAPARPFSHYAYFVLWPAALFAGSVWSLARSRLTGFAVLGTPLTAFLGALVIGGTTIGATAESRIALRRAEKLSDTRALFKAAELLPRVNGLRGGLFVWGWAPELYVWSGRTQATRDGIIYFQIFPSPLQDAFRRRMMDDLRKSPPDYIIDATGPGNLAFDNAETQGVRSFPDLAQWVAQDYTPIDRALSGTSCPRVYANHAATAQVAKDYVAMRAVSAASAPPKAETGAEFFQACLDTASLPPGQSSRIVLDLGKPQPIAAVEFLDLPRSFATLQGGDATLDPFKATVSAIADDAATMKKTVVVPSFPEWVAAQAPDGAVADKIVIDVENVSGGFTWIRVRR